MGAHASKEHHHHPFSSCWGRGSEHGVIDPAVQWVDEQHAHSDSDHEAHPITEVSIPNNMPKEAPTTTTTTVLVEEEQGQVHEAQLPRRRKKGRRRHGNRGSEASITSGSSGSTGRRRSSRWIPRPSSLWKGLHDTFSHHDSERQKSRSSLQRQQSIPAVSHSYYKKKVTTLLKGCDSLEQHEARVAWIVANSSEWHGEAGLSMLNFDFRLVPCQHHKHVEREQSQARVQQEVAALKEEENHDSDSDDDEPHNEGRELFQQLQQQHQLQQARAAGTDVGRHHQSDGGGYYYSAAVGKPLSPSASAPDLTAATAISSSIRTTDSLFADDDDNEDTETGAASEHAQSQQSFTCPFCVHCLFDATTETQVTLDNRDQYIADGEMYEVVARLCQEYAMEEMQRAGNLEWVDICQEETSKPPIRALVNRDHPLVFGKRHAINKLAGRPTLLIVTGKGKVRAGIFSRQHLLCTGLESATALPMIQQAVFRRLNLVVLDPNVHGDGASGMTTFEKSMTRLFCGDQEGDPHELFILSHSASGSQLARYLLDDAKLQDKLLPHIGAIAFTDSTHNIQWCKNSKQSHANEQLYEKLQSPECVYFRCANVRRDGPRWYLHAAGEPVPSTDPFWKHRFGKIQTYWAGTNEHSLTNWYSHAKIWEHFDRFLTARGHDVGLPVILDQDENDETITSVATSYNEEVENGDSSKKAPSESESAPAEPHCEAIPHTSMRPSSKEVYVL